MLRFTAFNKHYDDTLVIQAPDMELAHGIYWLKGENGSGKSTLIKSIAGLIPFNGNISVGGIDVRKNRIAYRLAVNYAEAEPLYPGFLTGNDLISFYLNTKRGTASQAAELMGALGVDGYAHHKIGTYSSGMAKKLSLVLGLLGQPKLVLLDEPLITLDQEAVSILQQITARYHQAGMSFLITSHQEITLPGQPFTRLTIVDKTLTQTAQSA